MINPEHPKRRYIVTPLRHEVQVLESTFSRRFSHVVKGDNELLTYWGASATVLSSDAYIIERSSVVHYVDNPVQNRHPLHTKYAPHNLYNKCNISSWFTDWRDELPFDIPPWPIPDKPTPPNLWLLYDNATGVATLRMETTSATTAILVRAIPWVWFNGSGPWGDEERSRIGNAINRRDILRMGKIHPHIHGYVIYPEGWHEIVEYKFDSIRGGSPYGYQVMKLKDLGPGVLHSTVGLIRRWKPFDVSGPEWPKFFKKYPPGKMAPLPYNWFAPATSTDINKDKDAVDKETREILDKLRRGRTK